MIENTQAVAKQKTLENLTFLEKKIATFKNANSLSESEAQNLSIIINSFKDYITHYAAIIQNTKPNNALREFTFSSAPNTSCKYHYIIEDTYTPQNYNLTQKKINHQNFLIHQFESAINFFKNNDKELVKFLSYIIEFQGNVFSPNLHLAGALAYFEKQNKYRAKSVQLETALETAAKEGNIVGLITILNTIADPDEKNEFTELSCKLFTQHNQLDKWINWVTEISIDTHYAIKKEMIEITIPQLIKSDGTNSLDTLSNQLIDKAFSPPDKLKLQKIAIKELIKTKKIFDLVDFIYPLEENGNESELNKFAFKHLINSEDISADDLMNFIDLHESEEDKKELKNLTVKNMIEKEDISNLIDFLIKNEVKNNENYDALKQLAITSLVKQSKTTPAAIDKLAEVTQKLNSETSTVIAILKEDDKTLMVNYLDHIPPRKINTIKIELKSDKEKKLLDRAIMSHKIKNQKSQLKQEISSSFSDEQRKSFIEEMIEQNMLTPTVDLFNVFKTDMIMQNMAAEFLIEQALKGAINIKILQSFAKNIDNEKSILLTVLKKNNQNLIEGYLKNFTALQLSDMVKNILLDSTIAAEAKELLKALIIKLFKEQQNLSPIQGLISNNLLKPEILSELAYDLYQKNNLSLLEDYLKLVHSSANLHSSQLDIIIAFLNITNIYLLKRYLVKFKASELTPVFNIIMKNSDVSDEFKTSLKTVVIELFIQYPLQGSAELKNLVKEYPESINLIMKKIIRQNKVHIFNENLSFFDIQVQKSIIEDIIKNNQLGEIEYLFMLLTPEVLCTVADDLHKANNSKLLNSYLEKIKSSADNQNPCQTHAMVMAFLNKGDKILLKEYLKLFSIKALLSITDTIIKDSNISNTSKELLKTVFIDLHINPDTTGLPLNTVNNSKDSTKLIIDLIIKADKSDILIDLLKMASLKPATCFAKKTIIDSFINEGNVKCLVWLANLPKNENNNHSNKEEILIALIQGNKTQLFEKYLDEANPTRKELAYKDQHGKTIEDYAKKSPEESFQKLIHGRIEARKIMEEKEKAVIFGKEKDYNIKPNDTSLEKTKKIKHYYKKYSSTLFGAKNQKVVANDIVNALRNLKAQLRNDRTQDDLIQQAIDNCFGKHIDNDINNYGTFFQMTQSILKELNLPSSTSVTNTTTSNSTPTTTTTTTSNKN